MLLLASVAAQLSIPVLDRGRLWDLFSPDDVPVELVGEGYGRRVDVRVTVGPDGKVRNCQAEFSSEVPKLDAYTCELIIRRAHFRPALWIDGRPAYGVIRTGISWSVDAGMPPVPGDLQVTLAQRPKHMKSPTFANLMFAVDQSGRPSSCVEEEPKGGRRDELSPELLKVACDQLLKSYVAIPAMDDAGRPVRSVQNAVVRLSVERGK
jgi:hypothetical protein